ncbi:MAG: DegT/DnrJ/EryC1/StrS family aminotransferase [Trichodesmium sp. MAG_R03]|nr:DegT/DnrJ/EryC1/StrS family aminotransferase [Trichodesmium sp. MAG_R03]
MIFNKQIKPFYLDITNNEIQYFLLESEKILKSGRLTLGKHTTEFEQAFAKYTGTKYAIAVNSGSSGLEIVLRLKKAEGTTILVPTNTNLANIATVICAGGKVQYLDMDEQTFAPSLRMVKETVEKGKNLPEKISGILWVHIGGIISPEFPQVVEYCHQQGLFVLEDTTHAHGSKINGVSAGNLADGATFSFFPTKIMTTFEGGMITLNNEEEDYIARSLRKEGKGRIDFGGLHADFENSTRTREVNALASRINLAKLPEMLKKRQQIYELITAPLKKAGLSFFENSMCITEINALLGRINLAKLPEILNKRQQAYELITAPLKEAGLSFVSTEKMDVASNHKLIVYLPMGKDAKEVKTALAKEGIFLGQTVYEIPCHQQPIFQGICKDQSFPHAEHWCPNHICPPLTSGMTQEDAQRLGEALVRHLK